jgi:hypothetical protein
MAQIEDGGGSGAKLSIDSTSKAARATLYDSAGNELIAIPSAGSFVAQILIRQSTTTAADAIVWSLFNASGSVKVRIRSLRHTMIFDGTTAAATTRAYYWQRTKTAAPTGGTQIIPTQKRSADAASIADVRFLDTGLTKGSMTVQGTQNTDALAKVSMPISATGGINPFQIPLHVMAERLIADITLAQNEGVGLFLNETTTAGIGIAGLVEWDESTS